VHTFCVSLQMIFTLQWIACIIKIYYLIQYKLIEHQSKLTEKKQFFGDVTITEYDKSDWQTCIAENNGKKYIHTSMVF
jgi:hypothetical protein